MTQKNQRPDLFRQNKISYEDKLGNFCILLSDDVENCSATIAKLPINEDGMRAITSLISSKPESVNTASAYKENVCRLLEGKRRVCLVSRILNRIDQQWSEIQSFPT